MAWVTPPTFVAGNVLTASQLNILSGDLNETSPAKATTAGQFFVAAGANSIVARAVGTAVVDSAENTTSATYADLTTPGPSVAVVTGATAFVWFAAQVSQTTATAITCASFEVSDVGTGVYQSAQDNWAVMYQPSTSASTGIRASSILSLPALHSTTNTFKMKYRASAGTGTFNFRRILVLPTS